MAQLLVYRNANTSESLPDLQSAEGRVLPKLDMNHNASWFVAVDYNAVYGQRYNVLTISLLIRQPQNKCVAESNNSLGFHRLLDSASHCTNSGSDLLDSAVRMHFTIYFYWGAKPPL